MPKIEVKNDGQNEEQKTTDEEPEKQFDRKEIVIEEKDKTLEKLYQNKELQIIHKPPKISSQTLVISLIISTILGILIGFFGAFYLVQKGIKIPFW